jgi:hypothetical protein
MVSGWQRTVQRRSCAYSPAWVTSRCMTLHQAHLPGFARSSPPGPMPHGPRCTDGLARVALICCKAHRVGMSQNGVRELAVVGEPAASSGEARPAPISAVEVVDRRGGGARDCLISPVVVALQCCAVNRWPERWRDRGVVATRTVSFRAGVVRLVASRGNRRRWRLARRRFRLEAKHIGHCQGLPRRAGRRLWRLDLARVWRGR